MPSRKKQRKQNWISKLWRRKVPYGTLQKGGSDNREFIVGGLIFIFIGLALGGGYAASGGAVSSMLGQNASGPAADTSGGTFIMTLPAAKGVNWSPWAKWAIKDGYNWKGIESDLADMQGAGIAWVRMIPSPSQTDNDRLFPLLKQYNLTPVVILSGNPLTSPGTFIHRYFYRNAIKDFITRYKDAIRYYEVWNEPNNKEFWDIDTKESSNQTIYDAAVQSYIDRLQDTYTIIKENRPDAFVLLGGIADQGMERWIEAFSRLKGYESVDIVSFHDYGPNPEQLSTRLQALKIAMAKTPEFGVKPIWVTEFGFTTDKNEGSNKKVSDEKTKAEYLGRSVKLMRDSGINGPLFWYKFDEQESDKPGFGLIMKNNTTLVPTYLPAYEVMRQL
jgi:hypothetical protein